MRNDDAALVDRIDLKMAIDDEPSLDNLPFS
jgi:hypothetical protein